jgi:catecholate siderophore receptor
VAWRKKLSEKSWYLALATFVAATLNTLFATPAIAQENLLSDSNSPELEEIVVTSKRRDALRTLDPSLSKLTERLRDTPQSITTMSKSLMEERGFTSLNDALRTVPGITLGAGEFSWQGNSPNIRGFSSRSDMFLDGMRDFGSYYRDPFNLETIEVLEGPSSIIFGRGSTGGVINQVSKTPLPDPLSTASVNIGNNNTLRGVVDYSRPLSMLENGAAFRINAMAHRSEVAGRDVGESRRFGIAPSLALGLGRATRMTLSYLHQESDSIPDYGLPWFGGNPAPVPRNNFYGHKSDYLDSKADIVTAKIEHEFRPSMNLHAKLRYARYGRDSRLTEPLIAATVPPDTPLGDITVDRNVFIGNSEETMALAQVDLISRFSTGTLRHALVTGIEFGRESSAPTFGFGIGVPGTDLLVPGIDDEFTALGTEPRLKADTVGESLAAYALDTVKIGETWQVVVGLRWDRFAADYRAARFSPTGDVTGTERIAVTEKELSGRAAIVYKPREEGSIYLGWGTSFNPSAEDLSFVSSGRGLTTSNANLEPEENDTIELGTKWELNDDALAFNAALFRTTKSNARVPDPENPGFNILGGVQRVQGVALNVSGYIASKWQLTAGYVYLDSELVSSDSGTGPVGSELVNVPEHSLSIWATYQMNDRLQFGAGSRYVSERLAKNTPPVKSVPSYWTYDAMGTYQLSDNVAVKLNLTNLTDEVYFEQLHPWHVIPGPGFTAILAINVVY